MTWTKEQLKRQTEDIKTLLGALGCIPRGYDTATHEGIRRTLNNCMRVFLSSVEDWAEVYRKDTQSLERVRDWTNYRHEFKDDTATLKFACRMAWKEIGGRWG